MTTSTLLIPPASTFTIATLGAEFATGTLADGTEALAPVSELPRRAMPGASVPVTVVSQGTPPVVSGAQADLVASLFYGVSAELRSGLIRVVAVARRPGERTKIAVAATRPGVDAVASLLGRSANRVKYVGAVLGGERIEVIAYHDDLATFVANALAPAKATRVEINEDGVYAHVDLHQRSAAIGGGGLNSALAGELVGQPITIVVD